MQHGELRTDRCPWFISAAPTSPTSLSQEAVGPALHPASTRSESTSGIERVRRDPSREPEGNQNLNKIKDSERVRETLCAICQNGQKNIRRILWMKVFQNTWTHPRVLLVLEARPPGIAEHSVTTASAFAVSSGEAGSGRPTQCR